MEVEAEVTMTAEPGNKRYGLILKGQSAPFGKPLKSLDALVEKSKNKPAIFCQDSDEDDLKDDSKIGTDCRAKSKPSVTETRNKKLVELEHQKALAEDPTAFSYDDIYDEMVAQKNAKTEEAKKADKERKPKYIQQLLRASERREKERLAREERKQKMEREAEGDKFKDEEVFVTGAYRKQMEEMDKYKEEEARREVFEERMDVTKQKDLSGFYKHLLNDTLAREPTQSSSTSVKAELGAVKTEPIEEPLTTPLDESGRDESRDEIMRMRPSGSKESRKNFDGKHKHKSYRRRESSESSNEEAPSSSKGNNSHKSKGDKTKSIYSSSSSDSEVEEERRKKRLSAAAEIDKKSQQVAKMSRERLSESGQEEKSRKDRRDKGVTGVERARRFFTPTPPSSPERSEGKSKEDEGRKGEDGRKKGEKRRIKDQREADKKRRRTHTDRNEESSLSAAKDESENKTVVPKTEMTKEEKEKERMGRLKELFRQKNDQDAIEEYRKRHFQRKANGEIGAPV